jgi:hypothetical protein
MSQSNDHLIRRSVRLYSLVLRLYPRAFRNAFGNSMTDMFERLLSDQIKCNGSSGAFDVWRTVLAELLPTIIRAHVDEAFRAPFPPPVRIAFAAALPIVAYGAAIRFSTTTDQYVVLTLWLILLTAAVLLARGRGWRCTLNAAVASAVGILLPALNDVFNGRMPAESFRVVPLLVAAAATIGLIFSVYVRLFIEGVDLGRPELA